MSIFWIALLTIAAAILNALAVIFGKFAIRFSMVALVVGVVTAGYAGYQQFEQAALWNLSFGQKSSLRGAACLRKPNYGIPIFWAIPDSNSQSMAEDLGTTLASCGWHVWLEPRAWVGPNVEGVTINFPSGSKKTAEFDFVHKVFANAGFQYGEGTETEGYLMPKGVGIKVGRRPSF